MKTKLLLINPWVYDFSALNLWSKPLGLLRIAEFLSQFDVELELIDCTDEIRTHRKYGTGKYSRQIVKKPESLKSVPRNFARYGISVEDFKDKLRRAMPCSAILVTSIMAYWYPGVQKAIEIIKSMMPGTPVILGGIYPSLYHQHALDNSGADLIFRGSINTADMILSDDKTNSESQKFIDTLENIGILLNHKCSPKPYYSLGFYGSYSFAPLLTSTGCPFSCSYCASSILSETFIQRDPSHIVKELQELYALGVRDYAFYDDALLVNADKYLKIILREIINSGMQIRFHCPNGIHARHIDNELALLMKQSGFTTLRLSLETVNSTRQKTTGGKITSEAFLRSVNHLKKAGFTKEHLGVYLMYGLPGQKLEEVLEGVAFLKSINVRINLTEYSPIPGTSCWDELVSSGVITDSIDPLLTNNSAFSLLFSGYGTDAIDDLKNHVKQYNSEG